MAQIYDINDLSYNAKENPEWFTRAMFGGRLVQGGYIRVLTGIKGDELLSQIDLVNKVLQTDGRDCAWTPNQVIKLSERVASVKTYKINMEQCLDELEAKRTLYMLSPGAKNESLPSELESATMALIAIGLSNEIEEMAIGGDVTYDPGKFNGMERILMNSSESIQLKGAVLSKSNVLGAIDAVYNAIPERMLQAEDAGTLFIMGSYNTRRLIRAALANLGNQVIATSWTVDDTDKKNPRLFYLGVEYVPVKGIGQNTLIGYDSSNAYLLTDLLSDLDEIELGSFPRPNEDKVFIKGRLRLGFVIPFEDEAVIMSPSIANDRPVSLDNTLEVVPNSIIVPAAGVINSKFYITTKEDNDATVTFPAMCYDTSVGNPFVANGLQSVTVTFTVDANPTGHPITGEIKVSINGGDRSAVVTLNQRSEDIDNFAP
jgi:hypothetical protein